MGKIIKTKPMRELYYRASRVARALGDPAKYTIVQLLLENGPLSVGEIVRSAKRSQPTVSYHLAQLRNLEIVRYETKPDGSYYWIKYPEEIRKILSALNNFIDRVLQGVEDED
uniref:ArsR family transcriptional regulator n=1 Tax=candidate division WOR-3 bacterium TaxID=2052148 RepID=A0A7C4TAM3_UNCW3